MYLKVKVHTNAKKNEAIKKSEDSYCIYTIEKPEQGKANKAVLEILSTILKVSQGKLRMVKGSKQSSKIFELHK